MQQITGLDFKIKEMAGRIKELREIEGYTQLEMAEKTGVSVEEYTRCENGESDLNFAFIYRCAAALRVNVTDIIEGFSPNLKSYTVTRAGAGQQIGEKNPACNACKSTGKNLLRFYKTLHLFEPS